MRNAPTTRPAAASASSRSAGSRSTSWRRRRWRRRRPGRVTAPYLPPRAVASRSAGCDTAPPGRRSPRRRRRGRPGRAGACAVGRRSRAMVPLAGPSLSPNPARPTTVGTARVAADTDRVAERGSRTGRRHVEDHFVAARPGACPDRSVYAVKGPRPRTQQGAPAGATARHGPAAGLRRGDRRTSATPGPAAIAAGRTAGSGSRALRRPWRSRTRRPADGEVDARGCGAELVVEDPAAGVGEDEAAG